MRARRLVLTGLERDMFPLMAGGMTNAQIARRLGKSRSAVGHAVERMMASVNAPSRTALISYAYVHGLLDTAAWPPALARVEDAA